MDAIPRLLDSFSSTNWDIFSGPGVLIRRSLNIFTVSVLDYINFCVDIVTSWKQIRIYPNVKPWMTPKVQSLLRAQNAAYRTGDFNAYTAAGAELRNAIRSAKLAYKTRIEARFNSASCPRQVWEGVRVITDYKGRTSPPVNGTAAQAEELNNFYTCFVSDNKDPVSLPPPTRQLHCYPEHS